MKYIQGTYDYFVEDGAEQYRENIDGAIFVQIDENVVGHDDSLNEQSITTSGVRVSSRVYDVLEVDVISWVYYNGDETGGGGFNWFWPDLEDRERVVRDAYAAEVKGHTGSADGPGVVRWVRIKVPDFRVHYGGSPEQVKERASDRITEWIDADIEVIESPTDANTIVESAYLASDEAGRRVLLDYILAWVSRTADYDSDTSTFVKEWFRTYGPDGDELTDRLAARFESELHEVGDEVMAGDNEKEVLTLSENITSEDDDGEFQGELAPFTPMLNVLLKDGKDSPVDDVEVWESGNQLLLVIKPEIGLCLGVADYVDENWSVCLYINHDNGFGEDRRQFGEGDLHAEHWMDVTDALGKVPVNEGHADQQQEIARRILYYLTHDEPFQSHQSELYEKYTRDIQVYDPRFHVMKRPDGNFEVHRFYGTDMGYNDSIGRFDQESRDYSEHAHSFPETEALRKCLSFPEVFIIDSEGNIVSEEA